MWRDQTSPGTMYLLVSTLYRSGILWIRKEKKSFWHHEKNAEMKGVILSWPRLAVQFHTAATQEAEAEGLHIPSFLELHREFKDRQGNLVKLCLSVKKRVEKGVRIVVQWGSNCQSRMYQALHSSPTSWKKRYHGVVDSMKILCPGKNGCKFHHQIPTNPHAMVSAHPGPIKQDQPLMVFFTIIPQTDLLNINSQ